ncbi:hypothetical protein [Cerasicoccus frondis]|uniref:hypothetical protein n=1 Tax=Cerasicoccus frondis TaxID=490090 RepID=UPI0028529866|nr:hypothetical protein [Cerasicoccus frondis]
MLGLLYDSKGEYSKAFKWFHMVAMQENSVSQATIALMYEKGVGVDPDPVAAYAWALLAARTGRPQIADRLSTSLSFEQRMAGQENAERMESLIESIAVLWGNKRPNDIDLGLLRHE